MPLPGPVTLNKQQFLDRRPGGSYQAYLGYLKAHRPAPSAPKIAPDKVVSRGGGTLVTPGSTRAPAATAHGPLTYADLLARVQSTFETPAQIEARANRMAQQQMSYQKDLSLDEYNRTKKDAMQAMLAQQAAGRAAAGMNAELMGRVGSAYGSAAGDIGILGGGLGAAVAGATAADVSAANAELGRAGAGPVSVGGPVGTPGIAGDVQAGVEQYRNATLPANQLTTAGQAQQLGLGGLIGAQNLRATQEANMGYTSAMHTAQQARTQALTELARKRPDLVSDYLTKLQDSQRQQIALASSLVGAGYEQKMTGKKFKADTAQIAQSNKQWWAAYNTKNDQWTTQFDENQRQFNASVKAKAAAAGVELGTVDAAASKVWGYLVDKAGRPIVGKDGKPIPVAKTGKTSQFTPGQLASLMGKAQDKAETFFYGYAVDPKTGKRVPATELGTFNPDDSSTWGTGALKWGQALSRLTQMGVPAGQARNVLSQYYERGDSGRPIFLPEEWAMLKDRIGKSRLQWLVNSINGMFKRGQTDEAESMIQQALGSKGGNSMWVGKPTG